MFGNNFVLFLLIVPSQMSIDTSGISKAFSTDVVQTLLQHFNGRAQLDELQQKMPGYEESRLYEVFHSKKYNTKQLLLFENNEELTKSVCIVYHPRLQLCAHYNDIAKGCKRTKCSYVHLCREFLVSSCRRTSCQFSHDIGSEYNKLYMERLNLNSYSSQEQLIFVFNSSPKVCADYNNHMGCERSQSGSCPDVHICAKSIQKRCNNSYCNQNHDISLCNMTLGKYITAVDKKNPEFLKKLIIVTGWNGHSNVQTMQRVSDSDEQDVKVADTVDIGAEIKIDEKKIFLVLLQQFQGKSSLAEIMEYLRTDYQGVSLDKVVEWYKAQKHMKIFEHKEDPKQSVVTAYMKSLKLCLNRNCKSPSCGALHICRQFIFGSCMETKCKFDHDFRSSHNNRVLERNGLGEEYYNDEAVKNLLYHSRLKCCAEYCQNMTCEAEGLGTCPDIHVCPRFIQGKCMFPDSECTRGHDLMSDKCMKTLTQYEIDHLTPERARRLIYVVKSPEKNPSTETNTIHIRDTDTFICENHIRKECDQGSWCPNHHYPLPYLWQMKYEDTWHDIREQNVQIESAYCNIYKSSVEMSVEEVET